MIAVAQKTLAVIVILLFVGAGFFIGTLASGFVGQLTVPASHKAIIEKLKITADSKPLASSYLSTGKSTWSLSTLQENFLQDGTYQYTLWLYSYKGDPEVYVCIWGPGEDGEMFQVEFSASYARNFKLTYGTLTQDFQTNTYIAVEVG